MTMAYSDESNLMIAAVLKAADPLRSVVQGCASGNVCRVVFYGHIYDALAQLPQPRAEQTVLVTARTELFKSGVTAAFEAIFKAAPVHFAVWHDRGVPLVSQPQANCCGRLHYIETAGQFDALLKNLMAARPPVSRPPILAGSAIKLPDTPLTEDEMDALLGVGL